MNKLLLLLLIPLTIWCSKDKVPLPKLDLSGLIMLEELQAAKRLWKVNNPHQLVTPSVLFNLAEKIKEDKEENK